MKTLAFFLVFCISLNVSANEHVIAELERQFDDYVYAVTVEWDQKDPTFQMAKNQQFLSNLSRLSVEKGLTPEDFRKIAEKKSIDSSSLTLPMNFSNMDLQELSDWLMAQNQQSYSQGASWNGAAVAFYGGVGLVVVSLMAYSFWFDANYECAEWVSVSRHNTCAEWVKK
jgi:hypothetical protein